MLSRRNFLTGSAVVLVGAAAVGGRATATIPEARATHPPLCARRCRRLWDKPTNRW